MSSIKSHLIKHIQYAIYKITFNKTCSVYIQSIKSHLIKHIQYVIYKITFNKTYSVCNL